MKQTFYEVSSNFWVVQSEFFFTNCGVIINGGQAILIDPGLLPNEIESIRCFLENRGIKPRSIVITHCHWDHILGPEYFPCVKVIAQSQYLRTSSGENGIRVCQQVAEWESARKIQRNEDFLLPSASETYGERAALRLGSLMLELMHTPGHADDHLVVYEPERQILWAGDMLSDLEIPYVCGNLADYISTIELLSKLDIQIIIPGHGFVTEDLQEIQARMENDKQYLFELKENVEKSIRDDFSMEDTVDACSAMNIRDPEENSRPHQKNVESAFLELGGVTDAVNVGWSRITTTS